MQEENTTQLSHGDMIRNTANNLQELFLKVADHIDYLENQIKQLTESQNESK
jgi:hypothetical protein